MSQRILRETQDGSYTVYNKSIDECYHSIFGALQESKHVFIKNGFELVKKKQLKIFEMGFGTGLNAFLTLLTAEDNNITTYYDTIELYPLENEILNGLSDSLKKIYSQNNMFDEIHKVTWEEYNKISTYFFLKKIKANLLDYEFHTFYDIVYFDAFSPEKQPELWSYDVFKRIYNNMANDSILTTYCAKGIVKRTLKMVGFDVDLVPGPPGKRQMIVARKN